MDKIVVIGDADTVLGFRLAGVTEARTVTTPQEAEEAVATAVAATDSGIMIVTQEVMSTLSQKTQKQLQSLAKPAVIEVPGKKAVAAGGESIAVLIKKVMGVELK
jgi:V/A-type H+-transporting ATPase subunit F